MQQIADLPGRCYWVKENSILAGGYPFNPGIENSDSFLKSLLKLGFSVFIDLTEEDELAHYDKILEKLSDEPVFYRRFAIEDYSIPDRQMMNEALKFIDDHLKAKRKIYIHCRGGIGRTGTVVGCWLKKSGNLSGDTALEELAKLFSHSNASRFCRSPEADEQIEFVKNFQINVNKA